MLGRKNYTQEELDSCKTEIRQKLEAYKGLVAAVAGAPAAKDVNSALEASSTI